jgi:hypothetical protein
MAAFLVSPGPARRLAKPARPTVSPCHEPPRRGALSRWLNALGEGLRRHRRAIQRGQWAIVFVYLVLVAVPAFLPLPGRLAHIWDNLTLLAQFAFWGIWWPFVLLSISGWGCLITGMMVREMTFHCEFKLIGTTGSMLRIFCVRPNGPLLKLLLFWNGTVISDAIGFCDALARSSWEACRPFARAEPVESSGVRVASSEFPLSNL